MDVLDQLDRRLFTRVAQAELAGAERFLPRLSRAANHGVLWNAAALGMALTGRPRARRAALRGVGSLAVASVLANVVAKRATRRPRPLLDHVPGVRHLTRQPITTSFPSGHSASAAAFALGVGLESPALGLAVAPFALAVMASRIYVGAHYPGDVLAGATLGFAVAATLKRVLPTHPPATGPATAQPAELPALPGGAGLHIVLNAGAGETGPADPTPVDQDASSPDELGLKALLPRSDTQVARDGEELADLLRRAAERARAEGGALGVCGGDGSVNLAAAIAEEHALPLAVFPGGTLNHFAADLGAEDFAAVAHAVQTGRGVAVDLGVLTDGGGPDHRRVFVNTFSIGIYPDLVRLREQWEGRIGKWPALALAVARLLPAARPAEVEIAGVRRRVWLVFAGNGRYRLRGMAPSGRDSLEDGLLDVRVVDAGHRLARTRLVFAFLTGSLDRTPVYRAARLRSIALDGLDGVDHLTLDGEALPAPDRILLAKAPQGLLVYAPPPATS
ncbi:bifunctional phosphatase PAP2/diacylglycerol kinase family protein [Kitasatospora camelliae]|uniref:Phosphatase PAP2 family protein n=1 Tax=Kitasatospora camelliae TaxID=3156397 RepID=A0AAU8K2D8_9ACTN